MFARRPTLLLFATCVGLATVTSAFAEDTVYDELNNFEKLMFGAPTATSSSVEHRLQTLEKNVFGKAQKGTTAQRLEGLHKLLDSSATPSKYMPAIAPVMDRSQINKEPIQAPEAAAANKYFDEPDVRPAGSSDKVRGMLKEAMGLYSQGKTAEAERIYQQVLAIDFRNTDANYNLGAIAEEQGRLKEAAGYYRTALQGNPGDLDLKDALAQVNQQIAAQTRPKPQAEPFKEVGSDAAMQKIAADAAALYKNGKYDEAITKLNYLVRQTPYDASVHFALGQALRGRGDNMTALRHLRAAATLEPKNDLYRKTAQEVEQSGTEPPQMMASDNRPEGEITPFNLPADNNKFDRSYARELDLADIGGLLFGSNSGYGRPAINRAPIGSAEAWAWSGGMPAYPNPSGSMRLRRAVQASLAGAAVGAMSNRGLPGGMKQGAMRGALQGGMYGLLFGGY